MFCMAVPLKSFTSKTHPMIKKKLGWSEDLQIFWPRDTTFGLFWIILWVDHCPHLVMWLVAKTHKLTKGHYGVANKSLTINIAKRTDFKKHLPGTGWFSAQRFFPYISHMFTYRRSGPRPLPLPGASAVRPAFTKGRLLPGGKRQDQFSNPQEIDGEANQLALSWAPELPTQITQGRYPAW